MSRVTIGPASPDRGSLDIEIVHLRGLDVDDLRARWRTVFRRKAPPHLPRHLLFRVLTYRLQADQLGDLAPDIRRVLEAQSDCTGGHEKLTADLQRVRLSLRPGTVLAREWDGRMHHVMVVANGFSWSGNTYPSLSKVASAITGTRWNGPRFFGLRDRSASAGPP